MVKNKSNKNRRFLHQPSNKSGQVQLTFSWIYIMLAGAIILLFFVGLVFKQQAAAEESLAFDVVQVMDSIFTGAQVSEKTKNFIDVSGLADYTLSFTCEDGLSEFGIKGQSSPVQNVVDPIFSLQEIKTTLLILWSLPYKLPFKVIDFMFVTSINTKYFILGDGNGFSEEFYNSTQDFNRVLVSDPAEINPEKNFQVRIIDLDGVYVQSGQPIPEKLSSLDDNKVTAISFTASNMVNYFQKEGKFWKQTNLNPVQIISLSGERNAAKYAAIFAANDKVYKCNMNKAFLRLKYLIEIYEEKAKEIESHYNLNPELQLNKDCLNYIQKGGYEQNINGALESLKNIVSGCLLKPSLCGDLLPPAEDLKQANINLGEKGDCLTLY